ncbi:unnamed protein product, partial [Heterosigma akashiwo]
HGHRVRQPAVVPGARAARAGGRRGPVPPRVPPGLRGAEGQGAVPKRLRAWRVLCGGAETLARAVPKGAAAGLRVRGAEGRRGLRHAAHRGPPGPAAPRGLPLPQQLQPLAPARPEGRDARLPQAHV